MPNLELARRMEEPQPHEGVKAESQAQSQEEAQQEQPAIRMREAEVTFNGDLASHWQEIQDKAEERTAEVMDRIHQYTVDHKGEELPEDHIAVQEMKSVVRQSQLAARVKEGYNLYQRHGEELFKFQTRAREAFEKGALAPGEGEQFARQIEKLRTDRDVVLERVGALQRRYEEEALTAVEWTPDPVAEALTKRVGEALAPQTLERSPAGTERAQLRDLYRERDQLKLDLERASRNFVKADREGTLFGKLRNRLGMIAIPDMTGTRAKVKGMTAELGALDAEIRSIELSVFGQELGRGAKDESLRALIKDPERAKVTFEAVERAADRVDAAAYAGEQNLSLRIAAEGEDAYQEALVKIQELPRELKVKYNLDVETLASKEKHTRGIEEAHLKTLPEEAQRAYREYLAAQEVMMAMPAGVTRLVEFRGPTKRKEARTARLSFLKRTREWPGFRSFGVV